MQHSIKIVCVALAAFYYINQSDARCNTCMANQVSCINETSFHMCFQGVLDASTTFSCPDQYVCTQLGSICAQRNVYPAACNVTSNCTGCDGEKPFICTGRTEYTQCYGLTKTNNTGTCPSGTVCNTSTGLLCVNSCTEPECDPQT